MAERKTLSTLAQLRKEHKPEKAFHFTVKKDFVVIFEDFNYMDEDKQDQIYGYLDLLNGGTTSMREMVRAGDELLKVWVGEETFERLREEDVSRTERALIGQQAVEHFNLAHGADDPKDR